MYKFKKIASAAASAVMMFSTVALAAAANYPAPFVNSDGGSDVAIVYGSAPAASVDLVGVVNIQQSLNNAIISNGGGSGGGDVIIDGDSYKIEKSATKFHLGDGILDVVSGTVTENELSALLADGEYLDDDNTRNSYTQKLNLGNLSLTHFEHSDYKEDIPVLGFEVSSNDYVLNYTLDFSDNPDWADMANTDIEIMGKDYFISSVTTNTTINLLDAAETTIVTGAEVATINIGENTYEVVIASMDSSGAIFDVNGERTGKLNTGQTWKLDSGAYIGLKDFVNPTREADERYAEFSIGNGQIELIHGSEVRINEDSVSDLNVYLSSANEKLQKIVLEWNADEDMFVTEDSVITMPGFNNIAISYTGMTFPSEEKFTIGKASAGIQLSSFPFSEGETTFDLLGGNGTSFTVVGKDSTHKLHTTNETSFTFDEDSDEKFIATYDDGSNAESYLLRIPSIQTENSGAINKTTIESYEDSGWKVVRSDAKNGDSVNIGSVSLTVGAINDDDGTVVITAGSSVNFNTLYTEEGLKLFLPVEFSAANYTAVTSPPDAIHTNASAQGFVNPTTFTLRMYEEDKNENKGSGNNFNATLGWSSSEGTVSGIAGDRASNEVESSDNFQSYVYSALATSLLHHTGGDQDPLDITYHGDESYANVFVTEAGAVIGGSGENSNVVYVSDTEASTVASRNWIVVGGSCVNSAAADLLGSSDPLCGSNWETETGVGSGQFLIETFSRSGGKVATLVAGYNQADTTNAATYLTTQTVSTMPGDKYVGTSSTSAELITG